METDVVCKSAGSAFAGSSPARPTFSSPVAIRRGVKASQNAKPRIITPVVWYGAPEWLTVEQACTLSGWDRGAMLEIIEESGVDLNNDGRIEERSLHEFQECLTLVHHWND